MFRETKNAPEFCGLVASGNLVEIEKALQSGAFANSVDQRGTPAVYYALQAPRPRAVIELLLRYGANIFRGTLGAKDSGDAPPFEAAIRRRMKDDPARAEELKEIFEIPAIKKLIY